MLNIRSGHEVEIDGNSPDALARDTSWRAIGGTVHLRSRQRRCPARFCYMSVRDIHLYVRGAPRKLAANVRARAPVIHVDGVVRTWSRARRESASERWRPRRAGDPRRRFSSCLRATKRPPGGWPHSERLYRDDPRPARRKPVSSLSSACLVGHGVRPAGRLGSGFQHAH